MFTKIKKKIIEFLRGFVLFPHARTARVMLRKYDLMFMTVVFGDMLGIPLLPPLYKLSLLPYYYPLLEEWKKRTLTEKDITESMAE